MAEQLYKWVELTPGYPQLEKEGKYLIKTKSSSEFAKRFPKHSEQTLESYLFIHTKENGETTKHFDVTFQIPFAVLLPV